MKRSFYKKLLNLAIYFCIFWKALCPFLGFAYLLTWILMILDISAFSQLDFFLGSFPRFIDSLFPHQTDIFGSEFPMGYIYCAALVIITMYFALKLQIKLLEKKARIENCEKKEKERSEKLIKRKKDKLPKINTGFVTNFYGLFEIDLKYTNSNNRNKENLEKLGVYDVTNRYLVNYDYEVVLSLQNEDYLEEYMVVEFMHKCIEDETFVGTELTNKDSSGGLMVKNKQTGELYGTGWYLLKKDDTGVVGDFPTEYSSEIKHDYLINFKTNQYVKMDTNFEQI